MGRQNGGQGKTLTTLHRAAQDAEGPESQNKVGLNAVISVDTNLLPKGAEKQQITIFQQPNRYLITHSMKARLQVRIFYYR